MQATQTQQGLHSVLEARGLIFMFPMMGSCLVWTFQIGSEQLEFQHSFPPACLPPVLDAGFVQHCFGVPTAERAPWQPPELHPSTSQGLCPGMWHRMCLGSSGRHAKAGVRRALGC